MNQKSRTFHELHASGCFVMPNPWDAGSAKVLAQLGFRALATTSAGFAWTLGCHDNRVSLHDVLSHYRAVAVAVDVPVNGDFEGGFAVEPEEVAENFAAAVRTGVAGLSIEDSTVDAGAPLYDLSLAVERVRAARRAIDDSGTGVVLTARHEGYLVGHPDLEATIRRLQAYAEAGADCLYAPGLRTMNDVRRLVDALAPKPVNVLATSEAFNVAELEAAGVRRISLGGALARAAWSGMLEAAREIAERGTFTALSRALPSSEFNGSFD